MPVNMVASLNHDGVGATPAMKKSAPKKNSVKLGKDVEKESDRTSIPSNGSKRWRIPFPFAHEQQEIHINMAIALNQ